MNTAKNPFGTTITAESVIDTLTFFDDWEERYKYIIDLGKEIPVMDEALKTEDKLVKGCQSKVWIDSKVDDGRFSFAVDSDAFIVQGLLAIVLAAINNKTAKEILDFDMDDYFGSIELIKHLSPTRGNGLTAIVEHIRALAQH